LLDAEADGAGVGVEVTAGRGRTLPTVSDWIVVASFGAPSLALALLGSTPPAAMLLSTVIPDASIVPITGYDAGYGLSL
jgi:hypothetical protein